jgi:hypothetical protein
LRRHRDGNHGRDPRAGPSDKHSQTGLIYEALGVRRLSFATCRLSLLRSERSCRSESRRESFHDNISRRRFFAAAFGIFSLCSAGPAARNKRSIRWTN